MSQKVVGLIRTLGVGLLLLLGAIFIIGAMGTEVDPDTNEPIGSVTSVVTSVNYAVYLVIGALIAIVVFGVWSIIQHPKRFIPTLIGVVVFGILVLIGYSMASSEILPSLAENPEATAKAHKWGGAGINTTIILVILALALILFGSVMGIMRYFSKS
ncbi:MAG: hypothetical protein HUJ25_10400 [Crocinitomicaceae bacterium]|nr:hypothetical protein [Crocinitomicaceae bacterium]